MDPFEHTEAGYNYSYSKMKIYMNRNDLGYLFGSFYGPTGMFAGLSLISYAINPDIVSNIILMNYKLMGAYKNFFSTCWKNYITGSAWSRVTSLYRPVAQAKR